ncbi:peptidase [Actinocatenispora thailandica]|uniref:Peptidase n=1 Tax=Actinocatenispora thailandica TaxID=227318 RepID=A0A7R7DNG5_9ACTN|nr:LON peptidase substrate-binding domain-containing protein [Actinocatenispora thailandica]BCJ34975.1 peptidase [Actinocatenispora thailandica]
MTDAIPLFPLGTVLFPGVVLPLHIFEPRYRALVKHLTQQPAERDREFGVVAIRRGTETGDHDGTTLYEVGCSAELRQVTSHPDGRYDVVAVGRRRFAVVAVDTDSAPYLRASVDWLPERSDPAELRQAETLVPSVLAAFRRYLRELAHVAGPDAVSPEAAQDQLPDDPAVLSHLVAASASLSVADRQRLLAEPDAAHRLRGELGLLRRETSLVAALSAVPAALTDFQVPAGVN